MIIGLIVGGAIAFGLGYTYARGWQLAFGALLILGIGLAILSMVPPAHAEYVGTPPLYNGMQTRPICSSEFECPDGPMPIEGPATAPPQAPAKRTILNVSCQPQPITTLQGEVVVKLLSGENDLDLSVVLDAAGRWSLIAIDMRTAMACDLLGGKTLDMHFAGVTGEPH